MPSKSQSELSACTGFNPETGKPCVCPKHKPPKGTSKLYGLCRCGHKKALHKRKPEIKEKSSSGDRSVDAIFKSILEKQPSTLEHIAKYRQAQEETNRGLRKKKGTPGKDIKPSKVCPSHRSQFITEMLISQPKQSRQIKVSAVVVLPSHLNVSTNT